MLVSALLVTSAAGAWQALPAEATALVIDGSSTTAEDTSGAVRMRPIVVELFPSSGGTIDDLVTEEAQVLIDGERALKIVWHTEDGDPLALPAGLERAEDLNASAPDAFVDGVRVVLPLAASALPTTALNASFSIESVAARSGELNQGIEVTAHISTHENQSLAAVIQWIVLEDLAATSDHPLATRGESVAVLYRFETTLNRTAGGETDASLSLTAQDLIEAGFDPADAGPLSIAVLVRDITSGEVFAADLAPIPDRTPRLDASERGIVVLLLLLAVGGAIWMVVGERSREMAMPRFSARTIRRDGGALRHAVVAQAGSRAVEIRDVKAELPWRVGGKPPRFELRPEEKVEHEIRLHRSGDGDDAPLTHWSIEVEGFGSWVIDLRFRPPDEEE